MRLTDGADRPGITLSTSRISGYSKTDDFAEFIRWVYQIKEQVSNYQSCESNDFLNGFASPSSYEQQHANLLPIGLVVMWEKLLTDISRKRITKITHNDETISDNFEQILKLSSEMLDLHATSSPIRYEAVHEIFGALQIKKNKKNISLHSAKMEQHIIHFDGDESMTLLAYLNAHHCFVVFFRERCMTYHAKTLYKDAQLPIRMKQFTDAEESDDANLAPSILQLVWLVSGLYTTCQSHHAELRILCRP